MSRRVLVAVGALLALVVAGTAAGIALALRDGGDDRLTSSEYLDRASALCQRYARQLDRITPPDLSSTTDVAASVGRALPVLRAQADAVRKLRPPQELEERVDRFFARTDRSLAALGAALDAARRGDRKAMAPRLGDWIKSSAAAQTASKQVGYRC